MANQEITAPNVSLIRNALSTAISHYECDLADLTHGDGAVDVMAAELVTLKLALMEVDR